MNSSLLLLSPFSMGMNKHWKEDIFLLEKSSDLCIESVSNEPEMGRKSVTEERERVGWVERAGGEDSNRICLVMLF